jgi:hypothetical protein
MAGGFQSAGISEGEGVRTCRPTRALSLSSYETAGTVQAVPAEILVSSFFSFSFDYVENEKFLSRQQVSGGWGRRLEGCDSRGGLQGWFQALAARLRRVRVCCGDWTRILGPSPTTCIGITGVFLDPPYAVEARTDVYSEDSRDVAHAVREWAVEHGDNPELRIALCGYEGEHAMPAAWECLAWKANGGFANAGKNRTPGEENAGRERIWFSPGCLPVVQGELDYGR